MPRPTSPAEAPHKRGRCGMLAKPCPDEMPDSPARASTSHSPSESSRATRCGGRPDRNTGQPDPEREVECDVVHLAAIQKRWARCGIVRVGVRNVCRVV